jgi:thiosulfate/3-mercaptopyruvate sulfurtransferase
MNGGRKKWELEGRDLSGEKPAVSVTNYQAKEADPTIRALRDEVIGKVGKTPMVDVRSPDEFSGKLAAPAHLPQEQAQRKGHIPGAKNVPWSKAANEDGTFKSIDELKALYQEEQGLAPQNETIAYCRIGERSSHTWFVLKELLGFPEVKNYDGSWTEYGSLVGVPIEREYREEAGS